VNRHFIFAILAAALAATVACGQWIESIIHLPDSLSGTDGVYWLEFDSLNNTVYAAGYPGTAVIDATSHNKIALLPFWGAWVGLDPAHGKLYVCGDSIYVLNARTRALLHTIPVRIEFYYVTPPAVISMAYNKLYVAVRESVAVIDMRGDSIIRYIPSGYTYGFCLARPERKLYCADGNGLLVIDCATDSILRDISTDDMFYYATAYNPGSGKLYYGSSDGLYVIDCGADTVIKVVGEGAFTNVSYDTTANRIYAVHDFEEVAVVDGTSDSLVKVITLDRNNYASGYYSITENKFYTLDFYRGGSIVDCLRDTLVGYFGKAVGDLFAPFCENPREHEVYCGDFEHGVVTVLDGRGDSTKASIITGAQYGTGLLWYDALSNKVYGLDEDIGGLSVIDAGSNTLQRTRIVAVDPKGLVHDSTPQKLYTLDINARQVVAISLASDTVAAVVDCPGRLSGSFCINEASNKVFCGARDANELWAIDTRVDSIAAVIPLPVGVFVLKSSPSTPKVFVTDGVAHLITVIDANGDSVLRTVDVPDEIRDMGYSRLQARWYMLGLHSIVVLDAVSDSLVAVVPAPHGVDPVWNKQTDRLYYNASTGAHSVVVFDCATNRILDTLNAKFVRGCDTVRNRVYCTDDSALLVYDGATDSLIARVPVPVPGYLALSPATGRVYLGSGYSDVYVIHEPSGVAEGYPVAEEVWRPPTIVRGVLYLPPSAHPGSPLPLLDICGRKVLDLLPGPNDIRRLAPGIYFVRRPSAASGNPSAVTKVVLTR